MTRPIVLLAVCVAMPAQTAREWLPVVTAAVRNIDEVSLLRGKGGTLHVVWAQKNGGKRDMMHRVMNAEGAWKTEAVAILSGWSRWRCRPWCKGPTVPSRCGSAGSGAPRCGKTRTIWARSIR